MSSRQQLLDSLTAHISLYHSQTSTVTPPTPNHRPALLRWFSSLSVHQRRAYLTILDPSFVLILLQMKEKLQSNGYGRFIVLPDLPQNDNSALPMLCYRKSDGLLSRVSDSNCAERHVHESVQLFTSKEGERDGEGSKIPCVDAMCVAEGLVNDVSRFVKTFDEITNGEFLMGGEEEGEMVGEWVELGWLKAKGYYSLEEFVVNRMEVALRLAWLNSYGGKKRGAKLKERLSAAGVAANLFWRKKGCVDWWEKLDDSVKKKVYCAYLGKAARSLTADIVTDKVGFLDDKMWCCGDQDKQLLRCDLDSFPRRDVEIQGKYPKTRLNAKCSQVSGNLSPFYRIFNSLYILQVISTLLSAAQSGGYEKDKLFFSSLDCVNSISDIVLRKMRELLMVISLDWTKSELLGEGSMNSLTKKQNDKHVTSNRKKKGKNHNKKSNLVPKPCQYDPKPIKTDKGKEDGIDNEDVRQSSEFDSKVPQKDLARGNHLSLHTMEPAKGVNNGKVRTASRKSRKERKKLKSSGFNSSEVGNGQPRRSRVSSASVSSPDGPLLSDWTSGSSTVENVSNNVAFQIDRSDPNSSLYSTISTDYVAQHTDNCYSTKTDVHLCLKQHPNLGSAVQNGVKTPVDGSLNCDLDSGAKTTEPVVEGANKMCTETTGCGNNATGCLGKQVKGSEPEVNPSLVQEQGSVSLLRVGAINSPAYISYEWPNIAPFHPSMNTHRPAATDRLHLDVGRNLQNNFHHSFVQVRNSPIDNAYNGIMPRPLPMSLDWPPAVRGVNRLVPSGTCSYDSEFISRRQSSFQQGITVHSMHSGATTSEDERTISSEPMDFPDVPNPQELMDEHDRNWMSEEELETHAISGMDYNQYFGGGVMYWNPSDHPAATSFSRPPSLCSDDSSWAWREADMSRAVDDMVAFSSSYSTNGLTSPSAASFCSPFDPLGPGPLGYVIPGSEISSKVLHSSSTMTDIGAEESTSGSLSNISGDGDGTTADSLPYPILRPIIIPNMSRERSRSEFKRSYDHKSPCVPPNRREQPRSKRPPSPVVLCVPRAPHPPPPSPVGDSRKHRGFPTVRSGSSSPRHWGVKGWFHDGVNFEEVGMPMEGEVVWPSWRKGLTARQMTQPLAGALLQDRLIAISQLARDQEHPDVTFPLQPPESQNNSTRKASLSLIHDILNDEINSFCKQVASENFIRKPYINWAVKRVARSLLVLWPRCRTNIYGSNATGLSLPSSDVDLVVSLPPVRNLEPIKEAGILEGRNGIKETCLQHAARYLANQEWVKSDSLKIVENTAIPIIMIVVEVPPDLISTQSNVQAPNEEASEAASDENKSFQNDAASIGCTTSPKWSKIRNDTNDRLKSVRLDISFKSPTHTGLQTTGLVKDLTERFPAVIPLALVLKQFLADRGLDQSYSGGLSSYCLILLITRFLQHERHHGRPINQNYGSLLMDFLYFFGNVFDPRQMRISVQGSGVYLNRERGCNIDPLCIDDPLYVTNNVGRNCFRIHQCIKAFADAHAMLESELACLQNDDTDPKLTRKVLPKLIPSIGHFVGS